MKPDMVPLIVFLCLGLLILVLYEVRERRKSRTQTPQSEPATPAVPADGECCGQHLVCERDSLLQSNAAIEYYDDEELDALAGIDPTAYSETQHTMLREVFDTLQERDVAGWVRSLQLRNIALPQDIREEALLIVRERRKL
ncbi:MAG: phospholipase [Paludibacteraceae bacterium]